MLQLHRAWAVDEPGPLLNLKIKFFKEENDVGGVRKEWYNHGRISPGLGQHQEEKKGGDDYG